MLFVFVVLDLVSSVYMRRDWLGRTSAKRPILCQVGRKNLTQSGINQSDTNDKESFIFLDCSVAMEHDAGKCPEEPENVF